MNQPDATPTPEAIPATPAAPAKPAAARRHRAPKAAKPAAAPAGNAGKAAAKKAAPKKPAVKNATAKPVAATKAAPAKTGPSVAAAAPSPKEPTKRAKLVRDSFTMPQADFALIDLLKVRALGFRRPTKKSELLRAGLQALAAMPAAELKAVLGRLAPLKTGRPKKAG